MRVLVTGGTGFLGQSIVPRLLGAGYRVRILARTPSPAVPGVEQARGSILMPSTLPEACAGCHAVIHLVGIISEYREQTFENVHTNGTRNLLAAATNAGVQRWIHLSALGVRPDAVARYHRSKWAGEEGIRAGRIPWTILRPSLVHGPGDGFTRLYSQMSRWSPILPLIGGGLTQVQPIAVADVAHCAVAALNLPETAGRTFELCGPDRWIWRELISAVTRAHGRQRWLAPVPWVLARALARLLEWTYPALLRQAPPLNRDQVQMLTEDNVGDPTPAARAFGFSPRPFQADPVSTPRTEINETFS